MDQTQLQDGSIDAGLFVLERVMPGKELSQSDIARVCGCSSNYIGTIERRAIKKMEIEFQDRLDNLTNMELFDGRY